MPIGPAQVRYAPAGSGCWTRGALIPPCPLLAEPVALVAGAGVVVRLSRGVCIPVGPVLALQWAACVPYHAVRPHSVPGALLLGARTPGSPGGQIRCGGPRAFILRAWGWVFLGSAVGWCSVGGKGWETGIGDEEPTESSCPCYFGGSACSCHFRSHSCTVNIVADTQQDDLLAVIHGETSQACCCFSFFLFLLTINCRVEDTAVRTTN